MQKGKRQNNRPENKIKNNVNKSKDASIKLTFRPTFVGFNPQSVEVKLTLIVRSLVYLQ